MSKILASVGIYVEQSKKREVLSALSHLEDLDELYEVKGEYDIFSLVSADGLEELRETLQNKIMKVQGIKYIIANIILKPHRLAIRPTARGSKATADSRRF